MGRAEVGALVLGAGVAGLAAARALARAGTDVCVAEAGDRPGGALRSERIGGFLVERGASTLLVKAPARAFLRETGIDGALLRASPASRLRFLLRGGRLVPVPMSPLAFARTPLLSARAKWRLLREPLVPRGEAQGESVAEFAARRLGPEVVSALVGPFLTGVYAGDERELGAEAVFPSLVELERRHGSIFRGALVRSLRGGAERGLPGSYSTADGLGGLAARLAAPLGERLLLGLRAVEIRREGGAWRADLAGPGGERTLRAHGLVIATPARQAAELLRAVDAEAAAAIGGIGYAPIAAVALGVESGQVREPVRGFGFLVPRDEGARLLGCLYMSQLFPGRAPEGWELLHCMLGGRRWPEVVDCPDDVLLDELYADLERALGLRSAGKLLAVYRWPRAVPQPGRDHPRRIAGIRKRLAAQPERALAGAYLDGVSAMDSLVSGLTAAHGLRTQLEN